MQTLPLALALVLAAPPTPAPLVSDDIKTDEDFVRVLKENYTKREFAIAMRDGVKLHTHVWTPKPASFGDKSEQQRWPFLILRTPYSVDPYGVENVVDAKAGRAIRRFLPAKELLKSGYIVVQQDVRGRMMSEGEFVDVRPMVTSAQRQKRDPKAIDEATDAWDTIDWLVKNVPHNNGRAGIWGISYPGFYAAQAAVDAHPALKAVSPQAPVTEWFIGDDFHHNGALCLADAFGFYAAFGKVRTKPTKKWDWEFELDPDYADAYDFFVRMGPVKNANARYLQNKIPFWNEMMAHPNRDAWWVARDPRPQYRDIAPAVLVVGGWFDAEDLWGALQTYQSMNLQTKKNNRVSLVMGPWAHGGWHRSDGDKLGDIPFGQKTSLRFQQQLEVPFFEAHLKGDGKPAIPEASIFVTGSNEWRAFDAWPPAPAKPGTLYFARGALTSQKPSGKDNAADADSFVADPRKPVPYIGSAADEIDKDFMTADQRFAARRPDVLVYESAPLQSEVTIAGPIEANVWLSTTGTDADVVVKLIDVWPEDTSDPEPNPKGIRMGGYQQLVRGEVMRGKFRNDFAKPEPFKPGEPALVRLILPDTAHTFRTGHRIAVQIQASWFPFVDSNPQTFIDINSAADDASFRAQTHTVHRSVARASSITVRVLDGSLP